MELKVIKNVDPQIHPTAIIDPTAVLHKNVVIGPYAVIGPGCEIGEGSRIDAHVVIGAHTRMGKNNHIFPHAVIGEEPQDLKYHGEYSTVVIGDSNSIREYCTIHRATGENQETHIGSHNMLQAYVHIAHNCNLGDYIVISSFSAGRPRNGGSPCCYRRNVRNPSVRQDWFRSHGRWYVQDCSGRMSFCHCGRKSISRSGP